jgi:NADPH:quinone reductase-like Zn-dependent oxidoreductase
MAPSAHAEFVCVRESRLVAHMPEGVTFEQAAAVPDGAYQGYLHLTRANVCPGTRLLVYGASGSCGTAAVQLAKHHFGAHVTAVCNGKNADLVRSLGADEVVDYEQEDFTRRGERFDVVLDAVGKHSFVRSRRALADDGIYVATDRMVNLPLALLTRWSKKKVVFAIQRRIPRDSLLLAKELIEDGRYLPVVDRTYPLEQAGDAAAYVDSWQKIGNVVLTVNGGTGR